MGGKAFFSNRIRQQQDERAQQRRCRQQHLMSGPDKAAGDMGSDEAQEGDSSPGSHTETRQRHRQHEKDEALPVCTNTESHRHRTAQI